MDKFNFCRFKKYNLAVLIDLLTDKLVLTIKTIKVRKLFQTISTLNLTSYIFKKELEGHTSGVFSLIKINKTKIASASADKAIKIWDLSNNSFKTLNGHTSYVYTLLKLNEQIIMSASEDKTMKIWNITIGECITTLVSHTKAVNSIKKISKKVTSNMIASGSSDKTIKIWEIIEKSENNEQFNSFNGTCILTLAGHTDAITTIEKLSQNKICSGSSDGYIKIWDISKQICLLNINCYANNIHCILKIDDNNIAIGSSEKSIEIKDFNTGKYLYKFVYYSHHMIGRGYKNQIYCIIKLNEKNIASGDFDNTINIWDLNSRNCIRTFSFEHKCSVRCLVKLNDNQIISGSIDSMIKIIDDLVCYIIFDKKEKGSEKILLDFINITHSKID